MSSTTVNIIDANQQASFQIVNFKDKLREKILSSFSDLIPPETMTALIDSEIKAFFETKDSLIIESEKAYVDRLNKRVIELVTPNNTNKYYSNYNVETKEFLAIKSNMTPFRQLVWSSLFEYIKPVVDKAITDNCNNVKDELNKYLSDQANNMIKEQVGVNFNTLAMFQSEVMFGRFASDTLYKVKQTLMDNFIKNNLNYAPSNEV